MVVGKGKVDFIKLCFHHSVRREHIAASNSATNATQ
jgi:hypothetical protein